MDITMKNIFPYVFCAIGLMAAVLCLFVSQSNQWQGMIEQFALASISISGLFVS